MCQKIIIDYGEYLRFIKLVGLVYHVTRYNLLFLPYHHILTLENQ